MRKHGFKDWLNLESIFNPDNFPYLVQKSVDRLIDWVWNHNAEPLRIDDIQFKDEKKGKAWLKRIGEIRQRSIVEYSEYKEFIEVLTKTEVKHLYDILLYIALNEPRNAKPEKMQRSAARKLIRKEYATKLYNLIREYNPDVSERKIHHCIGIVFYKSDIKYEYYDRDINPFSPDYFNTKNEDYKILIRNIESLFYQ